MKKTIIHRASRRFGAAVALGTLAFAAGVVAAQNGARLIMNGKLASSDVITVHGSAYVKVADVARALGMQVTRRPDGAYEIGAAGGANQVEGARGKVGDVVFTGQWRVTVLGVETPETFTMTGAFDPRDTTGSDYNYSTHVARAKPGQKLVVVRLRLSNGQRSPQTLWIAPKDSRTALTDTQGQSYPAAYDVEGAPIQTKPLLPGAKIEFPLVFSVPASAQIQDLVFTANNNDGTKGQKSNDVRISLMAK